MLKLWRSPITAGLLLSLTLVSCVIVSQKEPVAKTTPSTPSPTPLPPPSPADRQKASTLRQQGLALRQQRQLENAIATFRQATILDPTHLDGWVLLGWTAHLAGNSSDAMTALQSALKLNPNHVPALNALGIVNLVAGDLATAVTTHQQALKLKPDNEIAHYNLALAYDRLQQYDTAIDHAQAAAQLEPTNPHPLAILAIAHWHNGDRNTAIKTYRQAIALDNRYRDRSFLVIDLKAAAFSEEQIESIFTVLKAI
jgi:Flp pilus assembly protein TadD